MWTYGGTKNPSYVILISQVHIPEFARSWGGHGLTTDSDGAASSMVEAGSRATVSAIDEGDELIHLFHGSTTNFTNRGGLPDGRDVNGPAVVLLFS